MLNRFPCLFCLFVKERTRCNITTNLIIKKKTTTTVETNGMEIKENTKSFKKKLGYANREKIG